MIADKLLPLVLILAVILPLQAFSSEPEPASQAPEFTPLIPGTDTPRVIDCPDGTVYKYVDYTVYAEPSVNMPGENIYVYPAKKSVHIHTKPCSIKEQDPVRSYKNDVLGGAYFFVGLYQDYLFIDQGTGPSFRGLSIYDIKNGKLLFHTNYTDPVLDNDSLIYYTTIHANEFYGAKNLCPMSQHWRLNGFITLYQKEMSYNLETGINESKNKYRCIPGQ